MGAIAGSVISTLLPFLLEKIFPGQKGGYEQVPTMDPSGQGLYQQLMGGLSGGGFGGGMLGSGMQNISDILSGKPEAFEAFERPMQRQFREQTIPGLAETFTGMGEGGLSSSGFTQAMGKAGAGLSEQMGAMRGNMQQGAMGQLMQMLGLGMGAKPFETMYRQGQGGMGTAMAPGIGAGIGQMLPGLFQQGGSQFSNLFSGWGGKGSITPGPYGSYTKGQYNPYTDVTR